MGLPEFQKKLGLRYRYLKNMEMTKEEKKEVKERLTKEQKLFKEEQDKNYLREQYINKTNREIEEYLKGG